MAKPRYAFFCDNHTQAEVRDFACNFDGEKYGDQLARCGVDFFTFPARCNRGFAYYDTDIGTRHPALKRDLFGELAAACEKRNIAMAAYFNGGISGVEAVQHPEWALVNPEGGVMLGTVRRESPFIIRMCFNSPYRRHLHAMIAEVIEKYPHISGFFIDCLHQAPCLCPYCQAERARRGIGSPEELAKITLREFCAETAALVKNLRPGANCFFNSVSFSSAGENNSFLDCECLPTGGWGYEFLPVRAHWLPELRPGGLVFNMTGRFYTWGDFGGLRPDAALEYDFFYGLMFGMRPETGTHFSPRGELDMPVFDTVARVYGKLREFESFFTSAPRHNEVALVLGSEEELNDPEVPLRAAVRALEELHVPFSIITDEARSLDSFEVAILPENREISPALRRKLEGFGGAVIGCGRAAAEELGDLFGIECAGAAPEPVYYDAPGMARAAYAGAEKLKILHGAEGRGALVAPYCSKGFENGMAVYYTPPDKALPFPLTVRKGRNIFCAAHLFSGLLVRGAVHLRTLLESMLAEALPRPRFRSRGLYSFTRIALAEEKGRQFIYLLNYLPEARGKTFAVEEGIDLLGARVSLRVEEGTVEKVLWGSERRELPFTLSAGYCTADLPPFRGFGALEVRLS